MALSFDKARELLAVQVHMASGYNRNAAKLILAEVEKEHGQEAVDRLIKELGLDRVFGFKPGTSFQTKNNQTQGET